MSNANTANLCETNRTNMPLLKERKVDLFFSIMKSLQGPLESKYKLFVLYFRQLLLC